ncbi:glycosyltransferase [Flavobacteriales bacterium]|nr:glycosyltransferase [Flavobacteriales bacterium]
MTEFWSVLLGIGYAVTGLYGFMIVYAITGWKKLNIEDEKQPWLGVSILVAARNESENIETVIKDIFNQNYNHELFELIVIDDNSEDDTLQKANVLKAKYPKLKVISNTDESGKKTALQKGVNLSKFDTIATIDADCRVPSEWLITMTSHWVQNQTKMLLGPVVFQANRTVLQQAQSMEMLAIMGLTGGFASHGKPIMANGANLLFNKASFQEIGGYKNAENPSGDDVFTMLKFREKWHDSVQFVKHYESATLTKAEDTFSSFWQQRKRWLSKRSGYSSNLIKATAIITYLANVAAFVSLIAIIIAFGSSWTNKLMWVLFIKTLLDLVLTRTVSRDLQPHCGIANILMTEVFVAIYVTFLGIFGNTRNYVWKGRNIKVNG